MLLTSTTVQDGTQTEKPIWPIMAFYLSVAFVCLPLHVSKICACKIVDACCVFFFYFQLSHNIIAYQCFIKRTHTYYDMQPSFHWFWPFLSFVSRLFTSSHRSQTEYLYTYTRHTWALTNINMLVCSLHFAFVSFTYAMD